MDKMWLSFLKDGDGDILREAAALFIKCVPGTKTNSTCLLILLGWWESFITANILMMIFFLLEKFLLMLEKYTEGPNRLHCLYNFLYMTQYNQHREQYNNVFQQFTAKSSFIDFMFLKKSFLTNFKNQKSIFFLCNA